MCALVCACVCVYLCVYEETVRKDNLLVEEPSEYILTLQNYLEGFSTLWYKIYPKVYTI